jgi:signal transduction histidine kinase
MQATLNPAPPPDILIVDDSPSTLQLLSEIFKKEGYSTRAALSGRLALQSLRTTTPDLVLLDITMPDISGYDICKAMKADESLKDVPVIFISGHSQNIDVVKGFSVGGVDFVAKPFEITEAVARVKTHLELRRQQRALQKSYAELRSLEEMRDNLVHMIVHDLRNPLWSANIHLEQIQGLADATLHPRIRDHVHEALTATHTLMEMINSILDVNRMEAGLIPLKPEPSDLVRLIQDTLQIAAPLIKSRHLAIESDAETVMVNMDGPLIGRVIYNLLSNAISFTPETGGEIHFGISRHAGLVRVTIQDNGQGIPAEYHEKIFEKFYQMHSALSGERHSTGLGLTFCKLAVEAHGGKIGVQSEEKKGSLFWFDLPADFSPVPPTGESA